MPLFTDGSISGIEDLIAQDSQLLDVATVEGIDVTRKMASAQEEVGLQLITMLNRLHVGGQSLWQSSEPCLNNVVVTAALKLWHTYRSLEMVYSDAYNGQLNDRYSAKRDRFHEAAREGFERLIQIGVGMVSNPVPQARPPHVIAIPGELPDGIYYVTIAWLNMSGEEGASAVPVVITLSASTLQVQAALPPSTASTWNVYAGHAPESMTLQNSSPIPDGELWTQTSALLPTGNQPGSGQEPNYLKQIPRVLLRG